MDHLVGCVCRVGGCADFISNWAPDTTTTNNSMSRIELVPTWLLFPQMLDDFVKWLNAVIPRGIDRKIIMCEWCKYTGVKLTKELVDRVYEE